MEGKGSELSNKVGLGIIGEKFDVAVVKTLFHKKFYRIHHNNWESHNLSIGLGADILIYGKKETKPKIAIECKNWRKLGRPYGYETVQSQIMHRFRNLPSDCLKILIISFISLLTKSMHEYLSNHNILLIERGKLVGKRDFRSQVFYQLRRKLNAVIGVDKSVLIASNSLIATTKVVAITPNHNTKCYNNSLKTRYEHSTKAINNPIKLIFSLLRQGKGEFG